MFRVIRSSFYQVLLFVLVLAGFQIIGIALPNMASAVSGDAAWLWSSDEPIVFSSTVMPVSNPWCYGFFQNEIVNEQAGVQKVCMSSRGDVRFGIIFTGSAFLPVVGFPYDEKMYRVNGVCGQFDNCLYLPASDTLATKQYLGSGLMRSLVVYKNFTKRIKRSTDTDSLEYNFDSSNPEYVFQNEYGYAWPIGNLGASDDGNWLAIEIRRRGIGLLNIETLEMKRIFNISYVYGQGYEPLLEAAVSDGGKNVAIMGVNAGLMVVDVNPSCGDVIIGSNIETSLVMEKPCKVSYINTDAFIHRFSYAIRPKFTKDGGGLSFYALSYLDEPREVSLRAAGYGGQRLDYLALGDSFTSGEGEVDDSYYMAGTNDEYEKCHVGMRSYPYLISDFMNIEPLKMASVACSGATTKDVIGNNSDYWGQSGRLKLTTGLDKGEKTAAQSNALYNFLPGRVHQEAFVHEYNPKVITVGIGGNDAGLMGKLAACASPDTCDWASNNESKEQTAEEIKNLFGTLVKTYQQINNSSPSSKIYAVGYPKIISQKGKCDALTGILFDESEREFMNESVSYLNQVIEAAAKAVGIKYIDIQDSYGDQVLCGDKSPSAMNGVRFGDDNQYTWFLNIGNESFHPNPLGHSYEAKSITDSIGNLSDYEYCDDGGFVCPDLSVVAPEPSKYWIPEFRHGYPSQKIASYLSNRDDSIDNKQKQIQLDDMSLRPHSTVEVEITSDPISLGSYSASDSGSLAINIDLPDNLQEGYHTMHLYGTSYSGESIELYQVFEYKKPIAKFEKPPLLPVSNFVDKSKPDEPINRDFDDIIIETDDSLYDASNQVAYSNNSDVKGYNVVVPKVAVPNGQIANGKIGSNIWIFWAIGATILAAVMAFVAKITFTRKVN